MTTIEHMSSTIVQTLGTMLDTVVV